MAGASSRSHYFLHTGRKVQQQTYKCEALTLHTVCVRLLAIISTPAPERWQHGSHCPYSQDSMLTARLWASRHLSSVTSTSRWSPVRLRKGFWPAESTSSQPHGLCLWNRHPATDCHQEMREDKPSDTAWLYASHQSPSTLSSTGSWPYRSTSLKSPGTCACRDSNG